MASKRGKRSDGSAHVTPESIRKPWPLPKRAGAAPRGSCKAVGPPTGRADYFPPSLTTVPLKATPATIAPEPHMYSVALSVSTFL